MPDITRTVADNRINAWKNFAKLDQEAWRQAHNGKDYGQVLLGGGRPSDQKDDGPLPPANLIDYTVIDVYRSPKGYGWTARTEAVEAGVIYHRSIAVKEDGELVETVWKEATGRLPADKPTPIGRGTAVTDIRAILRGQYNA